MAGLSAALVQLPTLVGWRLQQTVRRLRRRVGADGIAILLGLALMGVLVLALDGARARARDVRQAARAEAAGLPKRSSAAEAALAQRSNLARFEDALLSHDDIPMALNQIFELAAAEKLVLAKGEYRRQVDEAGRFMRYRMALPVSGNAGALQRFIEQALADHPSLAFESVQFKRERIQSDRVEAQIQWTLITTLPSLPPRPAPMPMLGRAVP